MLLLGDIGHSLSDFGGGIPRPPFFDVERYNTDGPIELASDHMADDVSHVGVPLIHFAVRPAEGAEIV